MAASWTRWASDDLAQIATQWDRARVLLVPGRESWSERTLSDEERDIADAHARADRLGAAWNALNGLNAIGPAPAPPNLRVVDLCGQAEYLLRVLTDRVRTHLQLGPLFPADAVPAAPPAPAQPEWRNGFEAGACSGCGSVAALSPNTGAWWHHDQPSCWTGEGDRPRFVPRPPLVAGRGLDRIGHPAVTEAELRFRECRAWLAKSGLAALSGEWLEYAAGEIRQVLRLLQSATGLPPHTVPVKAPCPACQRMSLRAHIEAPNRREWWTQCHHRECKARWEWDEWGELGEAIGVDVWDAVATVTTDAA